LKKDVAFINTILLTVALFLLGPRYHPIVNSFSPLPIGVHQIKKYPHNRWTPRTSRGVFEVSNTATLEGWKNLEVNNQALPSSC
jgi:hypothetical protein